MLHLRAGRIQHREEYQRDHHRVAEVRLLENHQRDGRDDEKRGQRPLLEQPHALLALTQKIREKKHQREFRELHRLAYVGAEPQPSARAAAHDSQMGNIEQQQHRD